MKILHKNLKKGTRWANSNPKKAILLIIIAQSIMICWGLYTGNCLYSLDYKLTYWSLGIGIVVFACLMLVLNRNLRYLERIAIHSMVAYSIFFFSVHLGNRLARPNHTTAIDNIITYHNAVHQPIRQYAAIEYNPPATKKKKRQKRYAQKQFWKKKKITNEKRKKIAIAFLIVGGVLCILLAIFCACFACLAFCSGSTAIGIICIISIALSVVAAIVCFVFAVRMVKKMRKARREKQKGENSPKEKRRTEDTWDR